MPISAGTLAEVLIMAAWRNTGEEMSNLIEGRGFEVVSVMESVRGRIDDVAFGGGQRLVVLAGKGRAGTTSLRQADRMPVRGAVESGRLGIVLGVGSRLFE